MKLQTSGASPFGRKVKVVALERGLMARIQVVDEAVTPVSPNAAVVAANPLGKIPCLTIDDGTTLYDSRVICEHLDGLEGGLRLFPDAGQARLRALTLQALGDGMLDAAVGTRYETFLRPDAHRWPAWVTNQKLKVARSLDLLEGDVDALGDVTIGSLTIACVLGYLDFRFAEDRWRDGRPALAAWNERMLERPSLGATVPA